MYYQIQRQTERIYGIFRWIPKTMIFNPKYFDELCSKIMGVITDEEINTQIRLRAVRTVNAFTTLNNKMAARVLKYLELNKLLKLLYSCDSRGCTDILVYLQTDVHGRSQTKIFIIWSTTSPTFTKSEWLSRIGCIYELYCKPSNHW